MNLFQTRGFALKATPYSEADKLVQLYTQRFGKIRAIAKGIRKPQSRLAAVIELFTESSLALHKKGSSDLYVLGTAKVLNGHPQLKADISAITSLQVMADVLIQSLHDTEPHPELYYLILETLRALEEWKEVREQLLVAFGLRLLDLLGYPLELEVCAECQASLEGKKVFLIPHRGGALCENCCLSGPSRLKFGAAGLQTLRKLKKMPLEKAHILKMKPRASREIFLGLMDYIGRTVEKPLKTVEYYSKVLPV